MVLVRSLGFFYTKIFGNVSGVILADSLIYLEYSLLEIPTGAIADLLRKNSNFAFLVLKYRYDFMWIIKYWN